MTLSRFNRPIYGLTILLLLLGSTFCNVEDLCGTVRRVKEYNIPHFLNCCEQNSTPAAEAFRTIIFVCTDTKNLKDAYKKACEDRSHQTSKILECARPKIAADPNLKGKMINVLVQMAKCFSSWMKA